MKIRKIMAFFMILPTLIFANTENDSQDKTDIQDNFYYSIEFPEIKINGKSLEEINKEFDKRMERTMNEFNKEFEQLKKSQSENVIEHSTKINEYTNSFGIISVVIENYQYTGGAHGNTKIESHNYDIKENKELKFDDIFKPEAKEMFETAILQIVKDNNEKKYFDNIEKINLDTAIMYFKEDNVIFKFPQYEIAPYSSGMPEFNFHKDKVKEFLK